MQDEDDDPSGVARSALRGRTRCASDGRSQVVNAEIQDETTSGLEEESGSVKSARGSGIIKTRVRRTNTRLVHEATRTSIVLIQEVETQPGVTLPVRETRREGQGADTNATVPKDGTRKGPQA